MKPSKEHFEHSGNVSSVRSTQMSFDEDSAVHLMGLLTDLYSNPSLATIREYSTNAHDSHIASGNSAPIEVTLPSAMNSNYVVRDYGLGLSQDDIINNYSKYGWSSKRETNSQSGMLGIGCKAALTYTSQFIVKSVKDGIENTALITRDEAGAGEIQIVSTRDVEDPDGVQVTVPVSDPRSFNATANEFFSFWNPDHLLVNGRKPVHFTEDSNTKFNSFTKIKEGLWAAKNRSGSNLPIMIMGNIAYKVDLTKVENFNALQHGWGYIAEIPVGSVDFAPSREALQYNTRTVAKINSIAGDIAVAIADSVESELSKITDATEAAKFAIEKSTMIRDATFNWNSKEIQLSQKAEKPSELKTWDPNSEYAQPLDSLLLRQMVEGKTMVVKNYRLKNVSTVLKQYLLDNHSTINGNTFVNSPSRFQFCNEFRLEDYTPNTMVVDYEDIKPKLPRQTKKVKASKLPRYSILSTNSAVRDQAEYPTDDTVLWLPKGNRNLRYQANRVRQATPDVPVVLVGKNEERRFLDLHPDALTVEEYTEKLKKMVIMDLSEEEMAILTVIPMWATSMIEAKSRKRILDKNIDEALDFVIENKDKQPKVEAVARATSIGYSGPQRSNFWDNLLNDYPLISGNIYYRSNSTQSDHMVDYINAMYEYKNKQQPQRMICTATT